MWFYRLTTVTTGGEFSHIDKVTVCPCRCVVYITKTLVDIIKYFQRCNM